MDAASDTLPVDEASSGNTENESHPGKTNGSEIRKRLVTLFGLILFLGFLLVIFRTPPADEIVVDTSAITTAKAEQEAALATQEVQSTATAVFIDKMLTNLQTKKSNERIITEGELLGDDDEFIEVLYLTGFISEIQDFILEVDFENPYSHEEHAWDYGIVFRDLSLHNDEFRLILRSNRTWILINRTGDSNGETVAEGKLPNLRTDQADHNHIRFAALGKRGYLFVNGKFTVELDLSQRMEPGGIAIASGIMHGDEVDGEVTRFRDVRLWEISDHVETSTPTATKAPVKVKNNATVAASLDCQDLFLGVQLADHYVTKEPNYAYNIFFKNEKGWPEGKYQISVKRNASKSSVACYAADKNLSCGLSAHGVGGKLLQCEPFPFSPAKFLPDGRRLNSTWCAFDITLTHSSCGKISEYEYTNEFK